MAEWLKAFLYGVLEGVTEWLPISSTGHMILLERWLPLAVSEEFREMFFVVVQLGAILAVVCLFWKKLYPFSEGVRTEKAKQTMHMWCRIFVSCIPVVLLELIFGDSFEQHFYNVQTVAIMLVTVGILFLVVENKNRTGKETACSVDTISYKTALLIGVFQLAAAVLPGTSRSGATIVGGLALGLSRPVAAEYTFFLAVPVMFGAGFVRILQFGLHFTETEAVVLAVGLLSAWIVSLLVIRFLMEYVKRHDFKPFGWYRIALGIFVLLVAYVL